MRHVSAPHAEKMPIRYQGAAALFISHPTVMHIRFEGTPVVLVRPTADRSAYSCWSETKQFLPGFRSSPWPPTSRAD